MNLTKCKNGHFYDSDVYSACPHCSKAAEEENGTVNLSSQDSRKLEKTMSLDFGSVGSREQQGQMDDVKTVSIYQTANSEDEKVSPVVGWLVCTKGRFYGQDFHLRSGRNFIGRGSNMDVCLGGEKTVSRERHAIVVHEPHKNLFIAQPGESRELLYVNGNVVLSPVQLKKNDVLQVGEVELMLIPCCDEAFRWKYGNEK